VQNSYNIIAGGEQRSLQNGGSDILSHGFDDNTINVVTGNAGQASYSFTAANNVTLFASLVWNLSVSNDADLTATLHHLNLSLFDVTQNVIVATSASPLDNTQNLFFALLSGDRYEMRVTSDEGGTFSQDYALAWRMDAAPSPVPLPAAVWLFGSGLAGLVGLAQRRALA
jgi:hypothetical protein